MRVEKHSRCSYARLITHLLTIMYALATRCHISAPQHVGQLNPSQQADRASEGRGVHGGVRMLDAASLYNRAPNALY